MNKVILTIITLFSLSIVLIWYNIGQTTKRKKDKNVIVVGINAEYQPFTFVKDNMIVGFDIDLMNEIGQRLHKKIKFKNMPFNALLVEAKLELVNGIIGGISPTPMRQKQLLFTQPYSEGKSLIIVTRAGQPPLSTVDALAGKKVAVTQGFVSDLYMSDIKNGSQLLRLPTLAESFLALKNGAVDALVAEQDGFMPLLATVKKDDFVMHAIPETHNVSAIGIIKKDSELLEEIERVLQDMKTDGFLDSLKSKWKM